MPRIKALSLLKDSAQRPMLLAVMCIMASMAAFSLMNIFIREVATELHTTQIVFLRNLFSIVLFVPLVWHGGQAFWRTERPLGHFWRGTVGIMGMQLWFYCVSILPLNEATALSFTAPILTTIFAVLFLGEKASWRRWSAIAVGFVGALIIINPRLGAMEWELLLVPCATSLWAVAALLVKTLTRTEPPNRIVFYMVVIMTLWSFPMMLPFWQTPSWSAVGLCWLIAVCSTAAHVTLVHAYARADMAFLAPFDFFRLVFTAFFAYLAFGEVAEPRSWVGGGIIIASAAYIAYRESLLKQRIGKDSLDP